MNPFVDADCPANPIIREEFEAFVKREPDVTRLPLLPMILVHPKDLATAKTFSGEEQ
jgi:hypothetical protein